MRVYHAIYYFMLISNYLYHFSDPNALSEFFAQGPETGQVCKGANKAVYFTTDTIQFVSLWCLVDLSPKVIGTNPLRLLVTYIKGLQVSLASTVLFVCR